jgi:hypothetical protein
MIIHSGTPQGSVLSPDLYNFNVNDFHIVAPCPPPPPPLPPSTEASSVSESFAYFFGVRTSPDISVITAALNEDLAPIAKWADDKKILIAPNKSGVILFTRDQHQFNTHPLVVLDGKLIPLNQTLRMLGIYFDPKINFGNKALAGTDWGHHMETLLLTYKMLIHPTFTFGSPIWFPNTRSTNIKRLQVVQNKCLRVATGVSSYDPCSTSSY